MTTASRKQIRLGAQCPGLDVDAAADLARAAERGTFDFVWHAGGFDTFTVLAGLAAVTDRLGLAGTVDTTSTEPFEVARQFATLDHLSDGRAAWNIGTASDGFTGANFRRAGEFLDVARQFWRSWEPGAVVADHDAGVYVDPDRIHAVEHHGAHFDVRGVATVPPSPQGRPVLFQSADSDDARTFGAIHADVLLTPLASLEAGRAYYADVKAEAAAAGRDSGQLKVFAVGAVVLDDLDDPAQHVEGDQQALVGTAAQIADAIDLRVQTDACDGFVLVPHLRPHGLDEFVDRVVPLLRERGSFRSDYTGHTLRDHLDLAPR